MEIWYGCGLIIGPTLGGFLYEVNIYFIQYKILMIMKVVDKFFNCTLNAKSSFYCFIDCKKCNNSVYAYRYIYYLLLQIGGYKLPFLAMGGFLFVAAIATYFFLPEPSQRPKSTTASTKWAGEDAPVGEIKSPSSEAATVQKEEAAPVGLGGFHMFRMLKIPVIAMTAYSIVAATAGVGFISANLDAHLEQVC